MEICGANLYGHGTALIAATGGFLGGTSMMLYMRPASVADGLRRVVISVIAALLLTRMATEQIFDSAEATSEISMGVAFGLGFLSWSLLGAVAKFFERRQDQDIFGLIKTVKSEASDIRKPD